jgi:hypothetical protein
MAEQVYTLWENTFKAISTARQNLADEKSILESMFGDPTAIANIIETYLNLGMSIEDIIAMIKDPDAQINFNPWDFDTYNKSGK